MAKTLSSSSHGKTTSSLERIYLSKFNTRRYAYETKDYARKGSTNPSQAERHISTLEYDQISTELRLEEIAQTSGLQISYETKTLSLPVGSFVLFEVYDHLQNPELGELYLGEPNRQLTTYSNVETQDINSFIEDYFQCELDFIPRFSVKYITQLMCGTHPQTHADLWCVVESQVTFHEPMHHLDLAKEKHTRIYWLNEPPNLSQYQIIPMSSRYWMGEYHYKRLHRLPCDNELPGFEYEAKLSKRDLCIDETSLPFPVIERYQTESIRWYLAKGKGRIGFREGRASLVKKGKKLFLDGIIKRQEEKTQGLSMWSEPVTRSASSDQNLSSIQEAALSALKMRRVKRQLYLLHPQSLRVYALCLDDCRVKDHPPFHQIELEYNGRLLLPLDQLNHQEWFSFSTQFETAQILAQHAPKAALRCCERALLIGEQSNPKPSKKLYNLLHHLKVKLQAQMQEITVESSSKASDNTKTTEQEVLNEMREVLDTLINHQGCTLSTQTKRAWLQEQVKKSSELKPKKKKGKKKEEKLNSKELENKQVQAKKKNLKDKEKAEKGQKKKRGTKKSPAPIRDRKKPKTL